MAETATPAGNARTPNTTLYVLVGFLVTEIAMVACAFIWVFIYSTTIDTTGNEASYQAYAQDASPVVAVVVAFPIFFAMGRVFCRLGARATMAALIAVGINPRSTFPSCSRRQRICHTP